MAENRNANIMNIVLFVLILNIINNKLKKAIYEIQKGNSSARCIYESDENKIICSMLEKYI